jgi:hypothetical protein
VSIKLGSSVKTKKNEEEQEFFQIEGEGAHPIKGIGQTNSPGEVNPPAQLLLAANRSETDAATYGGQIAPVLPLPQVEEVGKVQTTTSRCKLLGLDEE